MIKEKDYKLNSILHIDNKWCKVVKRNNNSAFVACNNCALYYSSIDICASITCGDCYRKDNMNIKFITI